MFRFKPASPALDTKASTCRHSACRVLSEIARRQPHPNVLARFRAEPDAALFTSVVCIEEIHFGIAAGPEGEMVRQRMESRVLFRVAVLTLDEATAKVAGTCAENGSGAERPWAIGMDSLPPPPKLTG